MNVKKLYLNKNLQEKKLTFFNTTKYFINWLKGLRTT